MAHSVEMEKLLATFQLGKKYLDHVVSSQEIVDALINVKMFDLKEIMDSDHSSFIIKLNSKKLLKTKLLQENGSCKISKHINWDKVLKRVEKEAEKQQLEALVNQLAENEEAY